MVHQEDHRCHDRHQSPDRFCVSKSQALLMDRSQGLRGDLSKDQDQQSDDTGTDTYCRAAKQAHGQGGSKGRGGKIYNVISDQNGTTTFSRVSALRSPSWARVCIRILLTVVMEVSADEKNAERQIRMIRIRNCMASLESNTIQLL